ncbi:hypothetical protein BH11MYX4_BH11MYX4_67510 [soil metagenome]
MRRLSSVSVLVAMLALSRASSAQDDPKKTQAEGIFQEGLKLHDANRDADALVKYRQAYAVYPTPNILFAIARVEQLLGQSVLAITHLREALKNPQLHPRNQELGKGYLKELESKLARVILVGPAGLRVTVAGKEHVLPHDAMVDVEPGPVDARAELGGSRYAGRADTLAGSEVILELKNVHSTGGAAPPIVPPVVPPPEQPPPANGEPSNATRNVVSGALVAVGVVGLTVGVVFLAKAEGQISDAVDFRGSVPGGPCASRALPSCDRYASMLEDVKSSRDVGTVALVGGGIFLAAGITTFLVWPKHTATAWVRPIFMGNAAGLSGHF